MALDVRAIAKKYYRRKEIQEAIASFSSHKEVVPRYMDAFGKRPDIIEYPNDVLNLAEKGATSFHCSEEIWSNPMDLQTSSTPESLNSLRTGWDLIIDIDSDFLDYSKIATKLIINAMKFHSIRNIGLKYSGNKGFHIGIGWNAFPKEVNGTPTERLFPELARIVAQYLGNFIKEKLIDEISALTQNESYIRGNEKVGDFAEEVIPDIVLVSPRHLYRMPYSLNEKSGLVSVVINPDEIENFNPGMAKAENVKPRPFLPEPKPNEAKELVVQAMDWHKSQTLKSLSSKKIDSGPDKANPNVPRKEFLIKDVSPETYPPCVIKILNGKLDDGKKRAVFILINFFRSISLTNEQILERLNEWNQKNSPPLREGYLYTQINWHARQKIMLPPNCDKSSYKDIGVSSPDFFCSKIKNPVNYTLVKSRALYGKKDDYKPSAGKTKKPFKKDYSSGKVETGISKGYYKRVGY